MTPYHVLRIHFNIILPSTPGFSKWPLYLRFPHQNLVCTIPLRFTRYIPRPSHSRFDERNNICRGVRIIKLLIMWFSPLPCYLDPLRSNHSPILKNTLSIRFSFKMRDQVSHPNKTTGNIIFLHVLIFIFLDSKLEDKTFCTER